MDRDARARVEALFEAALELPPTARKAWLLEKCGGDESLLRAVEGLIRAHGRSGGILDRGVAAAPPEAGVPQEDHPPPERGRPPRPIGPYRILAEVGRGGMSVVYRAERSDGHFRRRVAMKVLRAELDAEELHARLASERQILASLDHPNIARLLDGGITEDGRPYLIMEYVEGKPLHEHCDDARLSVRARLHLFLEVVRAVQHAHARLVVHRDLKPSNIMVTHEGRVRLLDFGIAKVLDVRGLGIDASGAPLTRTGVRLLTPEYASPEQLRGEPASVANDVWALGVLLYELLTGARPFNGDDRGALALEREILETEPPRASVRVLHGSAERALRRARSPAALHRELRGDLDRIVAMALRKEPERRYVSAEQFAGDVERYLEGHPVLAQADMPWYRIGKFLRRHRFEAAAAAAVLVSILGGSGMALWKAEEARRERDRAEAAALRSEAVSEYLLDLFRSADPWEVPTDRLSARQILARGESRLAALPLDPVLRARMVLAMGQIYQNLGDGAAARPLLEEAVAARMAHLGPEHPATGEALRALAELRRTGGELGLAEELALAALRASRGAVGPEDPVGESAALDLLGFIYTGQGRLDDAAASFQAGVDRLRSSGLGDDPGVSHGLVNLGAVRRRQARPGETEALLREALEHRIRTLGPEHPLTALGTARLGGLLWEHLGRHEEAVQLFEEALEIQRRSLGPDHPARAEALDGLAGLHADLGDLERAEHFQRESVRVLTVGLGPEHPNTLGSMDFLANYLLRQGRAAEADSILGITIGVRRRTLGPDHPAMAGALSGWGRVLLEMGRLDDAESAFLEELRIRDVVFGPEHSMYALALLDLSLVAVARGDDRTREALLRRALGILERSLPSDHPETLRVREMLASTR